MKIFCLILLLVLNDIMVSGRNYPRIPEPKQGMTLSKILADCENWPHAYIETNANYQELLIFQWYNWNLKLYDLNNGEKTLVYLNTTAKTDIVDLINQNYFEYVVFKSSILRDPDNYGFTTDEWRLGYKIRQIMRKFKNFSMSLKSHPDSTMQFPTKIRICTNRCARKADTCFEINKTDWYLMQTQNYISTYQIVDLVEVI